MIKILIAGDFCPYRIPITDITHFEHVSQVVKEADYSIVNLECPIDDARIGMPINKIGPSLRGSSDGLSLLSDIGFKCVTLANNHFKDYNSEGCTSTFNALKKRNIDYVGAGENLKEASKVLYKEINSKRIAFVNCCEHEFSIATENSPGSNPMKPIDLYYTISGAKRNADYVVVITHGGIEMYNLPSPRMQTLYRYFVDIGADLVVNHHQHCFSGYEDYKGKRIYYGLGNFYFPALNHDSLLWQRGYMVRVFFDDTHMTFGEIPYSQSYEKGVCVEDMTSLSKEMNDLNSIISDRVQLKKSYDKLTSGDKYGFINPYNSRLARGLARRGLIPSFVSKKSLLELYAKIRCESHKDRFLNYLEKRINKG